jgi:hypothetical protein
MLFKKLATVVCLLLSFPFTVTADDTSSITGSETINLSVDGEFYFFDGLNYENEPDLSSYGLVEIKIIYSSALWENGESTESPNIDKVKEVAASIPEYSIVCIDIEHWSLTGVSSTVRDQNIAKYQSVAEAFKSVNSTSQIGFYSMLPVRDYWRALQGEGSAEYEAWQAENDALAPLADYVDIIFPSLYTFYDDVQGWQVYAEENLNEARIYDKPVVAFLWPEYHNSNDDLKGQNIPMAFWTVELEMVEQYADSVVLWGGYGKQWDDDAGWWYATRQFLLNEEGASSKSKLFIRYLNMLKYIKSLRQK